MTKEALYFWLLLISSPLMTKINSSFPAALISLLLAHSDSKNLAKWISMPLPQRTLMTAQHNEDRVSGYWELIGDGWPKFWSIISWPFLKLTYMSSLQRFSEWNSTTSCQAAGCSIVYFYHAFSLYRFILYFQSPYILKSKLKEQMSHFDDK